VCDAGGGTVVSIFPLFNPYTSDTRQDLISYTIEQGKPLKLAMCSEATGTITKYTKHAMELALT
jgi:hypothetical protein